MFYGTRFKVIFSVSKYMSTLICVYAYHTNDIIKINKYLVLLFKQQNHAYVTIIIIYQIFSNCNIIHVGGMFLSSGKIKNFHGNSEEISSGKGIQILPLGMPGVISHIFSHMQATKIACHVFLDTGKKI